MKDSGSAEIMTDFEGLCSDRINWHTDTFDKFSSVAKLETSTVITSSNQLRGNSSLSAGTPEFSPYTYGKNVKVYSLPHLAVKVNTLAHQAHIEIDDRGLSERLHRESRQYVDVDAYVSAMNRLTASGLLCVLAAEKMAILNSDFDYNKKVIEEMCNQLIYVPDRNDPIALRQGWGFSGAMRRVLRTVTMFRDVRDMLRDISAFIGIDLEEKFQLPPVLSNSDVYFKGPSTLFRYYVGQTFLMDERNRFITATPCR